MNAVAMPVLQSYGIFYIVNILQKACTSAPAPKDLDLQSRATRPLSFAAKILSAFRVFQKVNVYPPTHVSRRQRTVDSRQ